MNDCKRPNITLPHQNSTYETQLNSVCMINLRSYAVVFDNEPDSAGVTQLHPRLRVSYNWVTLASSGSFSNTTTPHVLLISPHKITRTTP